MFLRQSTSQIIRFGPCLDATDGVTEETALTLAQSDMRLSKDGAAFAQKSAAGNATHDSDGWYSTTLSTTDTATVGILKLNVHQPANMLPVWETFFVLEENIYDAWYAAAGAAGTDLAAILVDTGTTLDTKINTIDTVVDRIEVDTQDIQTQVGTAGAGLTNLGASGNNWNTVVPDAAGTAPTAAEINAEVDTALADYDGPTNTEMAAAFTEIKGATWSGTDTLEGIYDASGGSTPSAIADAVWDELQSAHTTAGSFGEIATEIASILVDTAEIGAAGIGLTNLGNSGNDWNTVVPDAAGVAPTAAEINAEVDTALADYDGPTNTEMVAAFTEIKGATWSGTDTLEGIFNASGGSTPASIADAVWDELLAGHVISDSAGELLNDWQNGGRLDLILDSRMAEASINTTAGAVDNVTLVDTTTTNTDMVGTDNAALATELAKVPKSDGTVSWNATALAAINAEADTALTDYDGPTNAEMVARTILSGAYFDPAVDAVANVTLVDTTTTNTDMVAEAPTAAAVADAVWDEAQSAHVGAGTFGEIATEIASILVDTAAIAALQADVTIMLGTTIGGACEGTPSTTSIQTNLTETTDDHFIGRIVVFTSGAAKDQATDITDYTGATGTLTVTALTTAPAASDTFRIV